MKIKLLTCMLVFLMALPLIAAPPKGKAGGPASLSIDNEKYINANNILMFVTNHGNFGRDLAGVFGYDAGTFFPYTETRFIEDGSAGAYCYYAGGLWVGATDAATGDTLIIIAEYSDEYVPGPMSGGTFMEDRPEFKVYKLYQDSLESNPNQDYTEYMTYAYPDMGAPWPFRVDTTWNEDTTVIVSIDTSEFVFGDQFLWAVFNDADPDQHTNSSGETAPLGLEVRQSTFAFNREDPLGNVIFFRLQVFNKGANTLENCMLSIWSDPDLGQHTDDLVGCDTTIDLGFVYNATNNDNLYENRPPSVGFDFFQGPLMFTGDDADTAKMWGQYWPQYQNMGMTGFNKYINGTDPNNYQETYNYMNGLAADGTPYEYPAGSGNILKHVLTGDPVAGTGDLDFAPADRRWMQTTGPITLAPGDSTEILAAMVVGLGGDRLTSISVMKYYDIFAQNAYDIDFQIPDPPRPPDVKVTALDGEILLEWSDTSEVDYGTFPFEGYSIFQGETPAGPWTLAANYDVVNGTAIIIEDVLNPSTGVLEKVGTKFGSDNGVTRYWSTKTDRLTGDALHNLSQYHLKVEAYSYNPDPEAVQKTLTSATVIPGIIPQAPVLGTMYHNAVGDSLFELVDGELVSMVTHSTGGSNGDVVVYIVNPTELTGHNYEVFFYDVEGTLNWGIADVTLGDTLAIDQTNQSGDNDYPIIDGFMAKVLGPAFGVVSILEVANAAGVVDPPDNVGYSLNSTADWYMSSDAGSDFTRWDWQGLIGTWDWEFRFTAAGSEYYDWDTDLLWPERAPFEFWNIGIGTPDDPSDDRQIFFFALDDDASGGWTWGDRIYAIDTTYREPAPAVAEYVWPDDFKIGRMIFNDYSETSTAPAEGTVIRITTAKVNTVADKFTFNSTMPTVGDNAMAAEDLEKINTVPNPYYAFGPFDPAVTNRQIMFQHLPDVCTIKIYTLSGDLIRTLEKEANGYDYMPWNVLTDNFLPVASGIYLYVVDAPGIGQKIGKMAVFTEAEVLSTY